MPVYLYKARTRGGELESGEMQANDRSSAMLTLERKGLLPVSLKASIAAGTATLPAEKTQSTQASQPVQSTKKIKAEEPAAAVSAIKPVVGMQEGAPVALRGDELLLFTEQMGHLLSVGMRLDQALRTLSQRLQQVRLKRLCAWLHRRVVEGERFSSALRNLPKIFPPMYPALVSAGEESGALPLILNRLQNGLRDMRALKSRVVQALVYPAFLMVASVALLLIFMLVLVPQLGGFFQQTGGSMPLPTRILVGFTSFLAQTWWVWVLALFGLAFGYGMVRANPAGRLFLDRSSLRIPVVGNVLTHGFFAQFSRAQGLLLENGVTLLRSLQILESLAGNVYIENGLKEARNRIADGETLSGSLARMRLFPPMYIDMLRVGEESGEMSRALQTIADIYQRELEKKVQLMTALLPPVLIVFIAVLAGSIIYSILAAVFEITASLRLRMQ